MSDGLFFTLAGLLAAAMIALALVWPQGLGVPTPVRLPGQAASPPAAPTDLKGPL